MQHEKYIVEVDPNTGTLDPTTAVPYSHDAIGAVLLILAIMVVGLCLIIKD